MILPPFQLHRPRSVEEALMIAGDCAGDFDFLGGGTDLLPNYKNRLNARGHVISLSRVADLSTPFRRLPGGGFALGAMARLRDIEADEGVRRNLPGILEAISQIATPLVRQSATLGGNLLLETRCYYFNQGYDWRASKGFCMKAEGDVCLVVPQKEICYAIYAGDAAPLLMALGATYTLVGFDGPREMAAADFYHPDGIRKSDLRKGEILTEVKIPAEAAVSASGYAKLRLRDSFDFPDMGVGASLRLEGARIEDLRVAVTAVSMTPLLFPEVTEPFRGLALTGELIEAVADGIQKRCQPVRNVMFPPQYRKSMVGVYTRRLLRRLGGVE
ncbi:MAG: FAD binding domain-containing protein [Acidobacteria bacterium]|nr:FAD binding domain-containing protein [Acidobacteriota bacterium]